MSAPQRIAFAVRGNLVPWQRMGRSASNRLDGRGVRTFKPTKVRSYQEVVAGHAMKAILKWRMENKEPWDGSGSFGLSIGFRQQDLIARDLDNLIKCIMDALQPVAFDNDALVNELRVNRVLDRDDPCAFIEVWRHEINPMEKS